VSRKAPIQLSIKATLYHFTHQDDQMLLGAIDPADILRHQQLLNFLSCTNGDQATKLSPCQDQELDIVEYIGGGADGLVFSGTLPKSDKSIALKLVRDEETSCEIELILQQFFHGEPPLSRHEIWPLEYEALYYASCAYHNARLSDQCVHPPSLPVLPYEDWITEEEDKLFRTIETDVEKARVEVSDRHEILSLFARMSAHGWLRFDRKSCRGLWDILPPQQQCHVQNFTGNVIVGVVKPLIKEEEWCLGHLQRRLRTLTLMKALGWKLREFEARNWINDCLVDGADVEVFPLKHRSWRKYWYGVFYQCIIQAKCPSTGKIAA
jgi:hypothetical protein